MKRRHNTVSTFALQTTFLIVDEAVSDTDLVVEADKFFAANESGEHRLHIFPNFREYEKLVNFSAIR